MKSIRTRNLWLIGAGLAWLGYVALGAAVEHAAVPSSPPPPDRAPPDVIVVGAGLSGLAAAIEAAEGGAQVLVVDASSVFGGHAVMSAGDICIVQTAYQEQHGVHDTPDAAVADIVRVGRTPDEEWVRLYAENSNREIYQWLTGMGVQFERLLRDTGHEQARVHRTKGRGIALVGPVYRRAAALPNIEFRWNVRVEGLVAESHRIVGVRFKDLRTGEEGTWRAPHTVLATGGFQSNLDMVRQYWTAKVPFPPRFLEGSGINSMGSGHALAQAGGADLVHMERQMNLASGIPDPRYASGRRGLNARVPDAIWVNLDGRRFVSEGVGAVGGYPVLLQQPQATYWAIFDAKAAAGMAVSGSDWGAFARIKELILDNPRLTVQAGSLAELAQKIQLPADALKATVARYNESVATGLDAEFGRFSPGAARIPGAIDTPPFQAIQFFPLTRKSMGGVAIDTECRVLDEHGEVIPGLYAVGELTGSAGINGEEGMGGMFLGPCIVTGRMAGRGIARAVGAVDRAQPFAAPVFASHLTRSTTADTTTCLSCHQLPTEVLAARPGYWHFEKAHHTVLERKLDCATCHGELSRTFTPDHHRINRTKLSQSCIVCHQADE